MSFSIDFNASQDTSGDIAVMRNSSYFLSDDSSSRDSGYSSPSPVEVPSQRTPEPGEATEQRRNFNFPSVKRTLFSGTNTPEYSDNEDAETTQYKRRRLDSDDESECERLVVKEAVTSDAIKQAVEDLQNDNKLVGDGSQGHRLPTVTGKHRDIKSVSAHTVSQLLTGKYDDVISGYQIIDCRYPYEYDGGHIKSAVNRCNSAEISELVTCLRGSVSTEGKILVFHCEFSSVRAPKLLRHLRSEDRKLNIEIYPFLFYPEVYLLDGGFKSFFHHYTHLCQPRQYRPMKHHEFTSDLRHFRSSESAQTKRTRTSARRGHTEAATLSCTLKL